MGSQRGRQGRAAGLRTPYSGLPGSHHDGHGGPLHGYILGFSNDPLRVSAQVISGIGFLGAGTILTRNHSQVTGLTTAAGLWTTASIGLAIGIGFYWAVVVSFIIVMITISILTRLERSTKGRDIEACYLELSDVRRVNEFCDHLGAQRLGAAGSARQERDTLLRGAGADDHRPGRRVGVLSLRPGAGLRGHGRSRLPIEPRPVQVNFSVLCVKNRYKAYRFFSFSFWYWKLPGIFRDEPLIQWSKRRNRKVMAMTEAYAAGRYEEACALLPPALRAAALAVPRRRMARVEELRLRVGRPVGLSLPEGEIPLAQTQVGARTWKKCWTGPRSSLGTPPPGP